MSISHQLEAELKRLAGRTNNTPETVVLGATDGVEVTLEFATVDRMSCALEEIRLHVPSLAQAGFDALKKWAEALSRRITYLLEPIGPVEFDPDSGEVLMRSAPPDQRESSTAFYEIRLQLAGGGNFALRRFRCSRGPDAQREQVPMQVTHEVLDKLLADLVATIPVDEDTQS